MLPTRNEVWSVRAGSPADLPTLRCMIYEALYWRPDAEREPYEFVVSHPEISRYLDGFGRPGDCAVIAELVRSRESIGAAWHRQFPEDAPGYGFVSTGIPELAIAVDALHRGRGVGRALLEALIGDARASGVPALSLSVEIANTRAVHLYRQLGFQPIDGDEHNHTMILHLGDTA